LSVSTDGNLGTGNIKISNNAELVTTGSSFSSSKTVVLGNGGGILASAPGATAAYSGVISGSGRLSIGEAINTGTIVLSALNTYTGGTIISAGTLQLGNGGTTGSIVGNVTDNGTLAFNRSDTVTFGGVLNASGNLVQNGTGTTILIGTNSYAGGTTINAGTLQIGNGGTSGSIVGDVSDNGSLVFNRSDTLAFTGLISGTGFLVQTGPGTTILTANNTYTGRTTISAGTLQLGNGGTTGSILGDVTDNGSLSFNRSDTVTFNAIVSGSGNLVQNGSGITVLGGMNTYSGGTIINNGTLLVNNSQGLGLGDVVVNAGVLKADPQSINVKGNYTQNAGGILQLGVGGSAAGQYDFLNVTGHPTLGGTLQLISLGGFQPKVGDKLTLVTAGGGISGQFASVLDPFSALVLTDLVYGQNALLLEFSGTDFAALAQTPNQLAVAKQLDAVAQDPREANLISFLESEQIANLPADFEKISPDSLTAFYEISFSAANVQAANLEERFAEIRNGSVALPHHCKSPTLREKWLKGTMARQ
jgi:fibronectin-binding autotransporter adhesin